MQLGLLTVATEINVLHTNGNRKEYNYLVFCLFHDYTENYFETEIIGGEFF